jgi:penicillin-binding protein 2
MKKFAILALAVLWLGVEAAAPSEIQIPPQKATTTHGGGAHRLLRYKVRRGDTLDGIAYRFKASVPEILRWNHLPGSRIVAGELLRLYVGYTQRTGPRRRVVYRRRNVHYRRVVHYRRHYWSPWNASSYGDPTAYDDPAGEVLSVRQAAVAALGKWNGSIVVVDPNTGRILSIVNQKLALESGFEPCSTMKPIVALAALKQGIITPETRLRVGLRSSISLTYALAHSNNNFFSSLGEKLGFPLLEHYATEFGLGRKAGLNIPGESPGYFPSEPPKDGNVGDVAYTGQNVEVTPLQMAAVVSAIANGGTLYYLQYPRTPEEIREFAPRVRRHLTNVAQYIPEVRAGMAAAVAYGTARSAYDPGDQIYGKTGTCSEDGARLGWFVSYSADEPQRVVVVLLRGGRQMYGPHAAEVAGRVYRDLRQLDQNVDREETSEISTGSAGRKR